jgi:hypothetical protein
VRRLAVLTLAAVAAAGCGSSHRTSPPAAPKLPRTLAQRLATESDAVASALARGDNCGAARLAERLRTEATASIARVPRALQEPLSSGVNAVVAEMPPCSPPAPAPAPQPAPQPAAKPPEHGKGHEKKHHDHKPKKHGDEDDG